MCSSGCVLRGHQCRYTWYEATLIVSRTQTRTNSDTFFFLLLSFFSLLSAPTPSRLHATTKNAFDFRSCFFVLCCAVPSRRCCLCANVSVWRAQRKEFNFCPFILLLSTDFDWVSQQPDFHSIKTNNEVAVSSQHQHRFAHFACCPALVNHRFTYRTLVHSFRIIASHHPAARPPLNLFPPHHHRRRSPPPRERKREKNTERKKNVQSWFFSFSFWIIVVFVHSPRSTVVGIAWWNGDGDGVMALVLYVSESCRTLTWSQIKESIGREGEAGESKLSEN